MIVSAESASEGKGLREKGLRGRTASLCVRDVCNGCILFLNHRNHAVRRAYSFIFSRSSTIFELCAFL